GTLLLVGQTGRPIERIEIRVDGADRRVLSGPQATVTAGGVRRPGDLLLDLARVVTLQVVSLATIDRVELDHGRDVVVRVREYTGSGACHHVARRAACKRLDRRRVRLRDVEIGTCAHEHRCSEYRREPR